MTMNTTNQIQHSNADARADQPDLTLLREPPVTVVESSAARSSRPALPAHASRILVVDDDHSIRELMCAVLAADGCEVDGAADGEQAWAALVTRPYDLLVTDNEMPRLSGLKLIERVRAAGLDLPVVIASGTLSIESATEHAQLGLAATLLKPFDLMEFRTIARIAMRTSDRLAAGRLKTCAAEPGTKPRG